MHAYYGSVSFEILAIFLALAFILATLPFLGLPHGKTIREWTLFGFDLFNETIALVLVLMGRGLWKRNQNLAEAWLGNGEAGQKVRKLESAVQGTTGSEYACYFFCLVMLYIAISTVILIWNFGTGCLSLPGMVQCW